MQQALYVWIIAGISIVSLVLNVLLIMWFTRLQKHYNNLVINADKKTLMSVLEGIQKTLSTHERSLAVHKKDLGRALDDARLHIQHLSLKRFNPFSDTGGDQSFMLSLLDGNKDGVVITSLHSRENTRFYVKAVRGGAGAEHPLSKEEQKIVNS